MTYSPLLAILTGILELGAAGWIFLSPGRGRKRILYPVGLIFLLLAGYQFAEVAVCSKPEISCSPSWPFLTSPGCRRLACGSGPNLTCPKAAG